MTSGVLQGSISGVVLFKIFSSNMDTKIECALRSLGMTPACGVRHTGGKGCHPVGS